MKNDIRISAPINWGKAAVPGAPSLRRETYAGVSFGETSRSDNRHVLDKGGYRADGTYISAEELNATHAKILARKLNP